MRTRSMRMLVSEVRLSAHSWPLEPVYEKLSLNKNYSNILRTNGRADSLTVDADQMVFLRATILPRLESDLKY